MPFFARSLTSHLLDPLNRHHLLLLMDKAHFFELVNFPSDIFSIITEFLTGQDVFTLWKTGSIVLQRLMSILGGVRSLNIDLKFFGSVGVPFGFAGNFPRLESLKINAYISFYSFNRYLDASTDLTSLPRTLTKISIFSINALEMFYNRDELALNMDRLYYPSYMAPFLPVKMVINHYRRISSETAKNVFYDLDSVLPNLSILEIGSHTQLEESFFSKLRIPSIPYDPKRVNPNERLQLLPNGSSRNEFVFQCLDIALQTSFFESLPKSLTKLALKMPIQFHYKSVSYIPSSVTDLDLYHLRYHCQENYEYNHQVDAGGDLQQDDWVNSSTTPSELPVDRKWVLSTEYVPVLPPNLRQLKVAKHFSSAGWRVFLERLPAALISLELPSQLLFNKFHMRYLPSGLTRLHIAPTITNVLISTLFSHLPPRMTDLKLDLGPGSNILDDNVLSYPLLPTLRKLWIKISPPMIDSFFASTTQLGALEALIVEFSADYNLNNCIINETAIALLPPSLTFLELHGCLISECGYEYLPSNLLHLKILKRFRSPTHYASTHHSPNSSTFHSRSKKRLEHLETIFGISKTIPDIRIFFMPTMRTLSLTFYQLNNGMTPPVIPQWNGQMDLVILTSLSMSMNHFDVPEDFCGLLPPSLTSLIIIQTKSELKCIDLLPRGLKVLDVWNCINRNSVQWLPPSLTFLRFHFLPSREQITMVDRQKGIEERVAMVKSLPRSLTFLNVSNTEGWGVEVIPHLPPRLLVLGISDCLFSTEAMKDLPIQVFRGDFLMNQDVIGVNFPRTHT
jgi:hypothetical protein